MIICKILHLRDDRFYVSRKEGGRRLTSTEDCLDATIHELKEYFRKEQGNTDYSCQ